MIDYGTNLDKICSFWSAFYIKTVKQEIKLSIVLFNYIEHIPGNAYQYILALLIRNSVAKDTKVNLMSKAMPLVFSTNLIIGIRAFPIT